MSFDDEHDPSAMCGRCGHHSDWHRYDSAQTAGGPLEPGAMFRCLGGSHLGGCSRDCPDFVRPLDPRGDQDAAMDQLAELTQEQGLYDEEGRGR
jgi:hypothetical protein